MARTDARKGGKGDLEKTRGFAPLSYDLPFFHAAEAPEPILAWRVADWQDKEGVLVFSIQIRTRKGGKYANLTEDEIIKFFYQKREANFYIADLIRRRAEGAKT